MAATATTPSPEQAAQQANITIEVLIQQRNQAMNQVAELQVKYATLNIENTKLKAELQTFKEVVDDDTPK